jgi:hypothetical protein
LTKPVSSPASRCSSSKQSHDVHSTSTEKSPKYVQRLERTAYKYVATERSIVHCLMLSTKGLIPHSLTLLNLRHVLYITTQKAVILNIRCGAFGGLEVACWPLEPKVRGFKPGGSRRIFQGEKKISSARLPSEVK